MVSCPETTKAAQFDLKLEKLKGSRYKLSQHFKKYRLYLPGRFTVIAKMILVGWSGPRSLESCCPLTKHHHQTVSLPDNLLLWRHRCDG